MCRSDFSLWLLDIRQAAGGKGNALREQQMSRNDIPIIVDSCIAFITQYGEQNRSGPGQLQNLSAHGSGSLQVWAMKGSTGRTEPNPGSGC